MHDIVFNEWMHVCAVLDQGADTVYIYINGNPVQVEIPPNEALPTTNATNPLYIGENPGYSSKPFNGLINDVRIYNVDLSAQEVLNLSQ